VAGAAPGGPVRLGVGRVGRAHGLRGEVRVVLSTNRTERLDPGSVLYAADRRLEVESARLDGRHWLVRFAGVDDRDAAAELTGRELEAEPLGPLGPDELWLHELVGATVTDGSRGTLGRVTAVEPNPAHDLLVVDGSLLVPIVFVTEVEPGRVVVDLPEGLIEATAPPERRRPPGRLGTGG